MCGISGFFSVPTIQPKNEAERLEQMRAALTHRGPDGSGIELFDQAALVHNRLAIIDLEGGRQPFFGHAGTCISFNGEIYNYRELRTRMGTYPFQTQSDTEVIVALYETEGISGFNRLRGMFAFALWDGRRGFLVRDPMGIKPLFYSENENKLLFASEAKGILAYTKRAGIDEQALHLLLNFRYVTGESSLFKGIHQVSPGSMLIWDQGNITRSRLTSADEAPPAPIHEAIPNAVASHLVADVPLGCYLSGGIDSALVAKLASRHIPLTSFTLEVGDDPCEADHAEETAAWLGIPNYRYPFHLDDPVGFHRRLAYHLETPKVNALQGALLAEFTAQRVKVALSGLGGDEIFYGYNAHHILWMMQRFHQGFFAGTSNRLLISTLQPFIRNKGWSEPQRLLEMLKALPNWSRVYGILRNVWDAPELRQKIYGERMHDCHLPNAFDWLQQRFPKDQDAVAAASTFELENKLVNDLLWQEDRVSMRVGLEVRVPFLDQNLVRSVRSKPRSELMPWGKKKYLLKRYAEKQLPQKLLRRPKSGFQLDIVTAAQGILKPVFDEYLSDERINHHRFFNPLFIRTIRTNAPHKGLRWHYFLLYLMAQTHILVEEYHAH
jgi:asparagine synthase (glutamine-hydrolysing)